MFDVLQITLPIYAIVAIGYVTVRAGWFEKSSLRVLGNYVMQIALPALMFKAVASRPVSEVFQPAYMLIFLCGGLATILLSYLWFSMTTQDKARRAVAVMGSACPNSGFIGYPVMLLALPDLAGSVLAMNMLVENIILIPICLVLLDLAKDRDHQPLPRLVGSLMLGVVRRPMVIGLLLGLVVSLAGVSLPAPALRLLDMLAGSAAALSLFVIGGALVGLPAKGNWSVSVQTAIGKLLLHPALTFATATLLISAGIVSIPAPYLAAVILSTAIPMFGIYATIAQEVGREGMASIAMMIATTASFVTIGVGLAVLL